ncbi:MAG: membrane protein insertase YidC [Alphaproteobacteria bacterium]|nr:membrane protein insertase YidC [Alphaproteobacteria bacterium]
MVRYLEKSSGFNDWMAQKDSGDKKSKFSGILWWVVIFGIAWWLFYIWMTPSKNTEQKVQSADVAAVEDVSNIPSRTLTDIDIALQVQGLRISNIELKNYKEAKNSDKNISLLSATNEFTEVGFLANGTTAPNAGTVWNDGKWRNADGVEFIRAIAIENYVITIKDTVKNNSKHDVSFVPYARIVRHAGSDATGVATGGVAFENGGIERESWKALGKKSFAWTTPGGFAGFEEQYWQTIISLDSNDQTVKMKSLADGRVSAEANAAPVMVPAGKSILVTTHLFAGPKTPDVLNTANETITGINQTIDYGWFWFLSRPFLWAINALHGFVGNYGVAIILFTILLRILMWPLTRKSFVGMAAMQKLQPEMQRIQKLYGDDKVRMQQEMMKLYRESKTSPMSGCLPMLLQIPIFFALYKALLISTPMRHSGFLWISDLAVMDPYFILPILMGASMWWQQHLQMKSSQQMDSDNPMAQTQKFMKWMPLLFTALFAWMPAGLVLYWTVSNLFGIGQMWWIKKKS